MVKTIRMSIGKINEDLKVKTQKMKEFDEFLTNELKNGSNIIQIQNSVTNDNEEYMIAVLGSNEDMKAYNPHLALIIFFLLIITLLILFNYHYPL